MGVGEDVKTSKTYEVPWNVDAFFTEVMKSLFASLGGDKSFDLTLKCALLTGSTWNCHRARIQTALLDFGGCAVCICAFSLWIPY